MSCLKPTLVISGICILAVNAAIGCSASSGDPFPLDDGEDSGPPVTLPEGGNQEDDTGTSEPVRDAGKDTSTATDSGDSGPKDGGSDATDGSVEGGPVEAGTDAAVDAGPVGSPCTTADQIQKQACGLCGTQARLCAPSSSEPGAPLVWQEWGFCQNEVENGCVPGTESTENCGLCGTRSRVCQNDCRYAVGTCTGEPANACAPGSLDYRDGLSCELNGRERTCGNDCQYGAFGDCIDDDDTEKLTLSGTAGTQVIGEYAFVADKKLPRVSTTSACPTTVSTTLTSYKYVALVNPTASTLVVAVSSAKGTVTGSADIDTVLTAYRSRLRPRNDAMRMACWKGVIDTCSAAEGDLCKSPWAGLVGANRLTIPANGRVVIYTAAYSATNTGPFRLIARTDTVTP